MTIEEFLVRVWLPFAVLLWAFVLWFSEKGQFLVIEWWDRRKRQTRRKGLPYTGVTERLAEDCNANR